MQGLVSSYFTSMMIAVAVTAYMLPTLVAWLRHAPDVAAVMIINLTLGWTVLGWWAASPVVQVFSQVNAPASTPPVNGYRAAPPLRATRSRPAFASSIQWTPTTRMIRHGGGDTAGPRADRGGSQWKLRL